MENNEKLDKILDTITQIEKRLFTIENAIKILLMSMLSSKMTIKNLGDESLKVKDEFEFKLTEVENHVK